MRSVFGTSHSDGLIAIDIRSTGGTASVVFAQGTDYTINTLPKGTKIVLSGSTYKLDYGRVTIGSLSITPSSGYELDYVMLNSTIVSTAPIEIPYGSTIFVTFKKSATCELIATEDTSLTQDDIMERIVAYLASHNISNFNVSRPKGWNFVLADDGNYYLMAYGTGRYNNKTSCNLYIALYVNINNRYSIYCGAYEKGTKTNLPKWKDTGLAEPDSYIQNVFTYGELSGLGQWISTWDCGDTCGLIADIKNLVDSQQI